MLTYNMKSINFTTTEQHISDDTILVKVYTIKGNKYYDSFTVSDYGDYNHVEEAITTGLDFLEQRLAHGY